MAARTGAPKKKTASSAKRTSSTKKPSSTSAHSRTYTAKKKNGTIRKNTPKHKKKQDESFLSWLPTGLVAACLLLLFWYMVIRPEISHSSTYNADAPYCTNIPAGFTIHGIDISHHQGDIDWKKLQSTLHAETPLSFIFIKATEGGDHKDSRFDENFAHAAEAGFIRGAYHFYNPASDPILQADHFIANVKLTKGDLPPVIDIESKPSRAQQPVFYAQLSTFLYRLEAYYGVTPIIYTSYKYKERYLSDALFDRYPLWIAHYHVETLEYTGPWAFWQHTDRAIVPGIPEETDLNVFHGTIKDLQRMALH